jgi:hypothetical protein
MDTRDHEVWDEGSPIDGYKRLLYWWYQGRLEGFIAETDGGWRVFLFANQLPDSHQDEESAKNALRAAFASKAARDS